METPVTDDVIPRLFRVILPVNDIEKAHKFYSSLLKMDGKRVSSGRHYFNCGGTILACFDPRADTDDFDLPPNPDHVYFPVKNLNLFFSRAQELGSIILDQIKVRPWGERSSVISLTFRKNLFNASEFPVLTSA